ncbi:sugar phosphate nucleotidyltransferase [Tellurirhabdus bombi]|uniref:sugar phosphate nucleotidyltransferase n=1 Tax=Tellurirhabdus bombi TaxID=2907205 RepID=UPI001F16AC25|nr:sugar phosphate nucleotidyltransferase [Tellurirhabdus bombi]
MPHGDYVNAWPVNVIIMAGGRGTRLRALTKNTPKPLIEVAEKAIIIRLIEHLVSFGFATIYVSVGHLSDQVNQALGDGRGLGVSIKYIHETTPMGSIGSLALPTDWEHDDFLVLNGDLYTDFKADEFIAAFFANRVDMAVLTYQNTVEIPWGVITTNAEGAITQLIEKPSYSVQVNTGIYLFNRRILNLLPPQGRTEGWELIELAINRRYKVTAIPLKAGYWIDIGTTETLSKAEEMARLHSVQTH